MSEGTNITIATTAILARQLGGDESPARAPQDVGIFGERHDHAPGKLD